MNTQNNAAPGSTSSLGQGNGSLVALLTGGSDRPYVYGLMTALLAENVTLDLIGSDELDTPEFNGRPGVNFLHFRGDQGQDASLPSKVKRILLLYFRLIRYAATARPRVFHILWNNKFDLFDRTLLMLYYKLLGKKIVLTVHNVNTAKRDRADSRFNRLTLRIQYHLADHIFVHTERMKAELLEDYEVHKGAVTVIPFGINNSIPSTELTCGEAKKRLGLQEGAKVLLFFGRIAPYKGLEYLIEAFHRITSHGGDCRLVIAGRVDDCEGYFEPIRKKIQTDVEEGRILLRTEYIPEAETEIYFKAADASVLPYKQIYQSGVIFLAYNFGLPVLAADVGSLKDDIIEGKTGFSFRREDPEDLAGVIDRYFASDLYTELGSRRQEIKKYATERHSWSVVSQLTLDVYANLLREAPGRQVTNPGASKAPLDPKVDC